MPSEQDRAYVALVDIRQNILLARNFVSNLTYANFAADI